MGRDKVFHLLYKEYNKTMGKGVKSCGKVCFFLYIEYIIKEYIRNVRKESGGKGKCGKEYSISVYRYSIIEIRKRKE